MMFLIFIVKPIYHLIIFFNIIMYFLNFNQTFTIIKSIISSYINLINFFIFKFNLKHFH